MDGNDILKVVFQRNGFYRRQYFLVLGVFAFSWVVMAILVYDLIYLSKQSVRPLYFATDSVSRLIRVIPETMPNMTEAQLSAWVVAAIQAAYSYDYINYRSQLQSAQKYFDPFGWSEYMKALTKSNNLLALTRNKMIVEAKIVGAPKLMAEGMLGGARAWKHDVNVLVSYWTPPFGVQPDFENSLIF